MTKPLSNASRSLSHAARTRTKGIALVAVLWVLVLLSVIAANLTATTRADISIARNVTAVVEARLLADAAVERAVFELLAPRPEDPWMTDGRAFPLESEAGAVRVSIQDETGKIDLNYGSEELLQRLLVGLGLEAQDASTLVDRIADYRDEDDLRRFRGAEAEDYRRLELPYGPANTDFRLVDELRRVPGVSTRLFEQLRGLVTVHSESSEIDPALAPERLLRVLPDLDAGTLAAILKSRAAGDEHERGRTAAPGDALGPKEGTFTIVADAHTASGGHYRRLAVIRTTVADNPPFIILDWRQDLDNWAGEDSIDSVAEDEDRL